MLPRFVQIHFLTSYPAALLNRDDAGFAKRIPFGGEVRTRVSSQCLKRHWRTFDGQHALSSLNVPGSVRSRLSFTRFVYDPLVDTAGPYRVEPALAAAVTEAVMSAVLGESAKAKKGKEEKKKAEEGESSPAAGLQTGQITVLGHPELSFMLEIAAQVCAEKPDPKKAADALKKHLGKDGLANLKSLKRAAGLDAALFGRMVTSDLLARGDAAVHVAHAFTVHAEASESDYFTAVDDLLKSGDDAALGSGHIGTTELSSGLFYGYVAVDVPLLVSNLEGCKAADWQAADRTLASEVLDRLVHLVATVSPGAKLGSTAPYAFASLVMVETGEAQPRTLANAFLKPVRERPDVLANAYEALAGYVAGLDEAYDAPAGRRLVALGPTDSLGQALQAERVKRLAELADWSATQVRGA